MSEKEIIIDGIDINKCQHYTGNVEYLSREWTCRAETIGTKCEENPNCYFKQLARAKDKINYMEEDIKTVENARNDLERELKCKEQELGNICKAFDIEYITDEETGNLIGRCNKLYKKEQECERLKLELSATIGAIDNVRKAKEYYQQECKELTEQLNQAKYLSEGALRLYSERQNIKYKQALDEIEKITKDYCKNMCMAETKETCEGCQNTEILNTINKAKKGN